MVSFYISENKDEFDQVMQTTKDNQSELSGGTEQFSIKRSEDVSAIKEEKVVEAVTIQNEKEILNATQVEPVKNGYASVNVEISKMIRLPVLRLILRVMR